MANVRFLLRRDTAANWTSVNPVLKDGEPALESNTRKVKYGDGVTAWNSLPYFSGELSVSLQAIGALTPAADRFPYFTSGSAAALGTITGFGRSLVDDADAAAGRTTLGLGSIATQDDSSVAITGGTIAGISSLTLSNDSGSDGFFYNRYSSSAAGGGNLIIRRGRGSTSSPAAIQSGDTIGGIFFAGWQSGTGAFTANVAAITVGATENYTSAYGNNITMATTGIGATSRATRTTIDENGLVQNGIIRPSTDNARTLGSASFRWSTVYAGTGTINTSDQRLKKWRGGLTAAELRAGKRIIAELGFYQWKDALKEKGKDSARFHFGVRAQRAFAILEDEGLDWRRYAWCCYDEWDALKVVRGANREIFQPARPKGSRYGVRMDQLALFLIAVQEARLARLEALASVE